MRAIAALLDVVPSWLWAMLCALLLATSCAEHTRRTSAQAATAAALEQLATERATAAGLRADAEARERRTEAEREDAIREVQTHAQTQIDALAGDLARARGAADSLRAAAQRTARAACGAGPDPAVAGTRPSQPGAGALDLLADLLSRADDAAGDLAAHADRVAIAGTACEAAYDAVRSAGQGAL